MKWGLASSQWRLVSMSIQWVPTLCSTPSPVLKEVTTSTQGSIPSALLLAPCHPNLETTPEGLPWGLVEPPAHFSLLSLTDSGFTGLRLKVRKEICWPSHVEGWFPRIPISPVRWPQSPSESQRVTPASTGVCGREVTSLAGIEPLI